MAEHLEAVAYGDIRKLLINIPPRFAKTALCSVAFPAWIWLQDQDIDYPLLGPRVRFMSLSYSLDLVREQISVPSARLIKSDWYQNKWGDKVQLAADQAAKGKFDTTAGGTRMFGSFGGSVLGRGADIKILDDPHNTRETESDLIREGTIREYDEVLASRVTSPKTSAEIIVMQRLHNQDLSGHLLEKYPDIVHLCLPAEYDSTRRCHTVIGWEDPREKDGELLWPEQWDSKTLAPFKSNSYVWAGQYQQIPSPRGGGIIKRDWWKLYPEGGERCDQNGKPLVPLTFPKFDYIIAYADTAFTTKEENDQSALTVWGVYTDEVRSPQIMLMDAWADRLEFNDLLNKIVATCRKRKVDRLIVEGKANGKSIIQEIRRKVAREDFAIEEGTAVGDKVARVHSIQHMLETGMVHAPDRTWAEAVISQCETFPRGALKDLVDTVSGALKHLRDRGFAKFRDEHEDDERDRATIRKPARLPYDV